MAVKNNLFFSTDPGMTEEDFAAGAIRMFSTGAAIYGTAGFDTISETQEYIDAEEGNGSGILKVTVAVEIVKEAQ